MGKLPGWAEFLLAWSVERERLRKRLSASDVEPSPDVSATVASTFVFEIAERANDRVVDHIDGLDALFAVIMTGVLAVVLLAIDRFRLVGLYPDVFIGWLAVGLLALAFYQCVRGIWRGNELPPFRRQDDDEGRDAPDPGRLISGIVRTGEAAVVSATVVICIGKSSCFYAAGFTAG